MRSAYAAALLLVAATFVIAAQDRSAPFRSGVDLISVTATVIDGDGHLVTGLPREEFVVYEDGEPQAIAQFTNERVPVSLAVLLDVSDSMFGQRLVDARSAVERFLFDLLDGSDEFSVVAFNHEPRPLTPWTQRPEVVRTAMATLQRAAHPVVKRLQVTGEARQVFRRRERPVSRHEDRVRVPLGKRA